MNPPSLLFLMALLISMGAKPAQTVFAAQTAQPSGGQASSVAERLDLNTATIAQLETLPGIEGQLRRGERPLHESLEPLIALLVPVFFVRMGMLVELRSFASASVLGFATVLTVAAVLGKWACGVAVPRVSSRNPVR